MHLDGIIQAMSREAVLIHGWNPDCYNTNLKGYVADSIAWKERASLINTLGRNFSLRFFNLPGFCGVPEPKEKYFDIEDFSSNFATWIKKQKRVPDLIIGYSFGGVVALDYKIRYGSQVPVVLISPALRRRESVFSKIGHIFGDSLPSNLSENLKPAYQALLSKYYRLGTPFIRESYDRIVRRDTSRLLDKVEPSEILLIYGVKDTATPWNLVKEKIVKRGLDYILIPGGDHNIGQTHARRIVEGIERFEKGL